ncbi:MAG: hypothetical protein J6W69_00005, partial [Bacteroidales bacterium]|nr:hypothetical protein [Bacteroidales bacterium]
LTICLLVFAAVVPLCAQSSDSDVIVLKSGERIAAIVFKVDDSSIYYRLNGESVEYQVSKQKVQEIRYAIGRTEKFGEETPLAINQAYQRIEYVTDDFYINHDYSDRNAEYCRLVRRQWRLNGWMKFCKIYGTIDIVLGIINVAASSNGHDSYDDDEVDRDYQRAVGIGCMVEGVAFYVVGSVLANKRKATRAEIMRINEVGLPVSEYRVGGVSLEPSVNLLSDRETRERTMGLGLRMTF